MKAGATDTHDEAYLVKCCKDNNPVAQKILYNKYVERMMIVCLRYIVNPEDAKEVLMDSFFKFFQNMGGFTYQGEGSVQAWLKKITINQCLMHLRKQQPVFISGMAVKGAEEIDNNEDIFGHLAAKDILKLIHTLPDGYRAVFNLYVFEGMGHKEIGELLNISESTSKSQLHRARALLKEKLVQAS